MVTIEWIRDPSGYLYAAFDGGRAEISSLEPPKLGNEYEYQIWWTEGSGVAGDTLTEEDAKLACERAIAERKRRR
jgi:hypothetical protein